MNRPLIVILAAVTLDAIGIGLIFPILPRLLEDVTHVDNIAPYVGIMYALYAAMQFMFSPVLGVMSDRFGRRPVLLISLAGAAIDYLFMAFAPELWMLVVGRAIAGLTSANMAVATAYITDITPEEQRAQRFGLFHAMFGIGFIIGPVLGGLLGDYLGAGAVHRRRRAQWRSTSRSRLFVLPESRPGQRGAKFDLKALNPLVPLGLGASRLKALLPLIAVFFILNFVGNMYGTVWALYGYDAFQWNGLMVGLSLAGYGLFHAGVQAVLPGPATKLLGEKQRASSRHGVRGVGADRHRHSPRRAGSSSRCCRCSRSAASACRRCNRSPRSRWARTSRASCRASWPRSSRSPRSSGRCYFAGFYFGIKDSVARADLDHRRGHLSAGDSADFASVRGRPAAPQSCLNWWKTPESGRFRPNLPAFSIDPPIFRPH